jgi:hypothetical protein
MITKFLINQIFMQKRKYKSRHQTSVMWTDITVTDLKAFLSVNVNMSMKLKPEVTVLFS